MNKERPKPLIPGRVKFEELFAVATPLESAAPVPALGTSNFLWVRDAHEVLPYTPPSVTVNLYVTPQPHVLEFTQAQSADPRRDPVGYSLAWWHEGAAVWLQNHLIRGQRLLAFVDPNTVPFQTEDDRARAASARRDGAQRRLDAAFLREHNEREGGKS